MSRVLSSKLAFATLAFVIGALSTALVLQPWAASAQLPPGQLDGLKQCLKGDKTLTSETGEQIDVQIVAMQLEGVSESAGPDPIPITLLTPGSFIPASPGPDATLQGSDLTLDVYYGVSLTDLGGVITALPCWCGTGLCRGECPSGTLICGKNKDCQ